MHHPHRVFSLEKKRFGQTFDATFYVIAYVIAAQLRFVTGSGIRKRVTRERREPETRADVQNGRVTEKT